MTLSLCFVAKVVNSSWKGLERTLEPSETALLRLEGGMVTYIFSWILPPHLFLSQELLSFPEMEFLEINLTNDSSLLLHAIHSLFRENQKLLYSCFKNTKKSTKQENSSLFVNSIL
jgi:hypothetical protein